MDLLGTIRKSGSRGGANFSWDEVQTSQHRENYLGHSLMAPVGRWQKGRDLNWYAKADDKDDKDGETAEERKVRERKEEIRRIKEAEEDALSRALGLPVPDRSKGVMGTGSNAIGVGELKKVIKETEDGDEEIEEVGRGKRFGDFVGKVDDGDGTKSEEEDVERGGLLGDKKKVDKRRDERNGSKERRHRRHRYRSRSQERYRSRSRETHRRRSNRSGERYSHRSRSRDRHRHRRRHGDRDRDIEQDRSPDRREIRIRSRSPDRRRLGREDRESRRYGRDRRGPRDDDRRRRRSRSPESRD